MHVHVHVSTYQELGQTREVNVLWLLTLSAPKVRVRVRVRVRAIGLGLGSMCCGYSR